MKDTNTYITPCNIAAFLMVLLCIQYIPIESRSGVSYLKVGVSALCPFIIMIYSPRLNRTMLLFVLYFLMVVFAAIMHPDTLRWSTLLFLATFIITYLTYYSLIVVENVFTMRFFVKLLRGLIVAYSITLMIQQFFLIVGIQTFPLINLVQHLDRGISANSLSYEPSSAAVILVFAFLSLLRMHEFDFGRKLGFMEIYRLEKWATIGFLWVMLTMGSGTAFIGLGILACYFIRPKHFFATTLMLIVVYIAFSYIDFIPLNRARESFLAFLSLDTKAVQSADGSAAARILPIINTLTKLDLATLEGWFGHGVDYGLSKWIFSDRVMVGGIADYGFLSFLVLQVIVYTRMIRRVLSVETLVWLGLGMATLGNGPVNWGAMMMFTTVRYFQTQKNEENDGCINNNSKF